MDDGAWQLSEAFTDSEAEEQVTVVTVEDLDTPEQPPLPSQSALQTTLGVASTAASFVLFPYVVAGKAAVQATSLAVAAPRALTNHVKTSITQSWGRGTAEEQADLFGEHSRLSTSSTSSLSSEDDSTLFQEHEEEHSHGRVRHLLGLPGRMVHTGVSTAVAIPTRVVCYSGRKIHGAVTTSTELATTAVVASTGAVARTGMHVARGVTHGAVATASFTASTISGVVGASARTVSYVIPPSVSSAVWRGVDQTGNVSVNVVAHAIAVPSYRMLRTLVPDVETCFSEEECVNETRAAVRWLVKVLGPQNAFYLLKYIYETVNSEEAHDAFLLCRDILHESLNGQNYRKAGASVGAATGITTVVHVMKEAYSVLPSFDELRDAAALVADVSDEVLDGVSHVVASANESSGEEEGTFEGEGDAPRFEYLDDEPADAQPVGRIFTSEAFERQSSSSSEEQFNPILESGISLLTRVCDSEEATSLFNTVGDFLDVLVD